MVGNLAYAEFNEEYITVPVGETIYIQVRDPATFNELAYVTIMSYASYHLIGRGTSVIPFTLSCESYYPLYSFQVVIC